MLAFNRVKRTVVFLVGEIFVKATLVTLDVEMLSDDQITECLDQLKLDLADAEARLADAADDEKAAIREEISQMHNLQISLMSEQLNRLKGTTEAAG